MTDRQKPRTLSDDDAPDFLDGAPRFFQQYFWERLHCAGRTGRQAVDDLFGGSRVFENNEEDSRNELGLYVERAYRSLLEGQPIPPR